MVVEPADITKYYDANKQKYTQVRVKAIYIAFSDDASSSAGKGKKPLTEAEAKAKAAKLKTALKGGADFVKLVKENSDDETSREKDGDFATLRSTDNIPDAFRAAVFALKQGRSQRTAQTAQWLLPAACRRSHRAAACRSPRRDL